MFISINLDPEVVNYLDNVCGGPTGRANFIQSLIIQHFKQNQTPVEPTYEYPENCVQPTRLHRCQKGFEHPQIPLSGRKSGPVRKPREVTYPKRRSGI